MVNLAHIRVVKVKSRKETTVTEGFHCQPAIEGDALLQGTTSCTDPPKQAVRVASILRLHRAKVQFKIFQTRDANSDDNDTNKTMSSIDTSDLDDNNIEPSNSIFNDFNFQSQRCNGQSRTCTIC